MELDGLSNPVPKYAAEAFAIARALSAWRAELEILRLKMDDLAEAPGGAGLDRGLLDKLLRAAHSLVAVAEPFSVCDCEPDDEDCPHCKGRRWRTIEETLAPCLDTDSFASLADSALTRAARLKLISETAPSP